MHKFWGPLPSFICAWIYVVILRPAEVAIIVMTFAEYAIQPFLADPHSDLKDTAIKLASLSALCKYYNYVYRPVQFLNNNYCNYCFN